jgi:protein-disulfide isomerase
MLRRAIRNAFIAIVLAAVTLAVSTAAQTTQEAQTAESSPAPSPEQAKILQSTEAFVRNLFAWGPDIKVTLGPLAPSVSADFYNVPVQLTVNNQTSSGTVYVSKDGKTFLRGDVYDMSANPFADNLAHMNIEGNPSLGPANARVTIVEFSDFECPHCRELYRTLKALEPLYPQVRVVFKDFPLTQIHPWTETASIGARCAYIQSPDAFWQLHDAIFESQDLISTENVWEKVTGFAKAVGLDTDAFKACTSSPGAQKAVDANRSDGIAVGVTSTPTVFVNGRMLVGGDRSTLEQYIKYELAKSQQPSPQQAKPIQANPQPK